METLHKMIFMCISQLPTFASFNNSSTFGNESALLYRKSKRKNTPTKTATPSTITKIVCFRKRSFRVVSIY